MAGPRVEALLSGLRSAGYGGPEQIEIVLRTTDGDPTRITPLVAEVVERNVDVIVAISSVMVQAFRQVTRTIPIIALDLETDPADSGLVASVTHPGGNITGLFFDFPDFTKKWLELLREAIPQLSRIAVLWDPATYSALLTKLRHIEANPESRKYTSKRLTEHTLKPTNMYQVEVAHIADV
jgi:putative ABC transport system substrate-binding protein